MQDFIVLGLIPGTNMEVTFMFWLLLVTTLLAMEMLRILHRNHVVRNSLITLAIILFTNRRAQG